MLHTILWDWNGTLLDDVEVALAAMNEMLARRGLSLLGGREPYRVFPPLNGPPRRTRSRHWTPSRASWNSANLRNNPRGLP